MFARTFSWLLKRFILFGALCVCFVWGWFAVAGRSAPTREQMAAMMTSGEVKRDRVGDHFETKCLLPLSVGAADVSAKFRAVLLGAEDRGFASEPFGLSLRGLAGAFGAILHGHARGGSTITQQLVKNMLFEPGDGPLLRKIYEIPWAVTVHHRFTTDEILAAYLNHLPFQHGIFGIEAASLFYFGKPASELNYPEAALIEVMLSSPRNDLKGSEPDAAARARTKARTLLKALVRGGVLPREALRERERPGEAALPDLGCGYVRDYAEREIRGIGGSGGSELDGPLDGTWRAYVTVDAARQAAAMAAIDGAASALRRGGADEAALVGLDRTGGIVAFVGGTDYEASQFDRAGLARRSPGSLGKILVLAEACERGYRLDSMVEDVPQPGGRPADDDGRYLGRISLGEAFRLSRNAAMFGLERALGHGAVAARARLLGVVGPLPEDGGIAVGDFPATLVGMTAMIRGIANGGRPVEPYAVRGIVGHHGRILAWHKPAPSRPALSDRCARMLDRALRGVVTAGTGRQADIDDARGKTGTSNAYRDAWFVGYVRTTAAGVWVGNDDDRGMARVEGGGLPAQLFRAYIAGYAKTPHRQHPRSLRIAPIG